MLSFHLQAPLKILLLGMAIRPHMSREPRRKTPRLLPLRPWSLLPSFLRFLSCLPSKDYSQPVFRAPLDLCMPTEISHAFHFSFSWPFGRCEPLQKMGYVKTRSFRFRWFYQWNRGCDPCCSKKMARRH